jgi:ribonuclease PH
VNEAPAPRRDRADEALRPISVRRGGHRHADGAARVEWGHTHVVATVSLEAKLPPHLRGRGVRGGWLTAEYAMLPGSTRERTPRERGQVRGRSHEIQRFLGRALRAAIDLDVFTGKTLHVDCDVLQADGGTRCAAVLAGYTALHDLAHRLVFAGKLDAWPLRHEIAAVSVGMVSGRPLLDLDHDEDAIAEADLAVVGTADGQVVEVHGGGEGAPLDAEEYVRLVALGLVGVRQVLERARAGWSA